MPIPSSSSAHNFRTCSLRETLRIGIPDSLLMIIPNAYHTLEKAALTADLLARFPGSEAPSVTGGR